jgi:hypothetical protein
MLFNLLAVALAPLAVSAVPVRRATDANTLLVAREFFFWTLSLPVIKFDVTYECFSSRIRTYSRTSRDDFLPASSDKVPSIGFHYRWFLIFDYSSSRIQYLWI